MRMSSLSNVSFAPKDVSHNYVLNQHVGNQGTVSSNFWTAALSHPTTHTYMSKVTQ